MQGTDLICLSIIKVWLATSLFVRNGGPSGFPHFEGIGRRPPVPRLEISTSAAHPTSEMPRSENYNTSDKQIYDMLIEERGKAYLLQRY